jgi:hypothetical protein
MKIRSKRKTLKERKERNEGKRKNSNYERSKEKM